jgi:hypothetical protein
MPAETGKKTFHLLPFFYPRIFKKVQKKQTTKAGYTA